MTEFSKILIANRGEIAVRVIRTAKKLGYATVAVYSDADADALHVKLADEAVHIGPSSVTESYLRIDNIIAAARATGADAIHPGYGFLSENCAFAAACEQNNLVFIGPPSPAIELMGSKRRSKLAVEQAGVPTVPGYDGADQSLENLTQEAARIGTPLMIKASAGGGGRGMRLVHDLANLKSELSSARSEAENAFGDGELILERAILNPRHIEIQIFADQLGNVVYLGERDCSVQRRHQKVVEEAPSPFVSPQLRQTMGAAAVKVAKLCNYVGAGTVEFLVDETGQFYFLEMNTRLQVEHPVTELITGTDLVEWQLRVAAGEPLPQSQEHIKLQGHAIEVRLYAEDAYQNYLPQTGPVHLWHTEPLAGIRVDSGIHSGSRISPFYDPMVAKIIAHGPDRTTAIRKLDRALGNTILLGTPTNKRFLRQLIGHPAFKSGQATTSFIEQYRPNWQAPSAQEQQAAAALAAALLHSQNPGSTLSAGSGFRLTAGDSSFPCRVSGHQQLDIRINDELYHLRLTIQGHLATIHRQQPDLPSVTSRCHFHIDGNVIYLDNGVQGFRFEDQTHAPAEKSSSKGTGKVLSPMDGNLMAILVEPGARVSRGDVVAVVEAMKMEHQLKAGISGTVQQIAVNTGDQLKARQLILLIDEEK